MYTLSKLRFAIINYLMDASTERKEQEVMEAPVYAYFDFPLNGVHKKYKIVGFNKGSIVLYNDEIQRPKGHG